MKRTTTVVITTAVMALAGGGMATVALAEPGDPLAPLVVEDTAPTNPNNPEPTVPPPAPDNAPFASPGGEAAGSFGTQSQEDSWACDSALDVVAIDDSSTQRVYAIPEGENYCDILAELAIAPEDTSLLMREGWSADTSTWPVVLCEPVPEGECVDQRESAGS
ncbi:hypothetical protein ACWFMI_27035 [Nocardiopsis terrae]